MQDGYTSPLITLLESLGQNAFRRDEVQVGRDRTVNVLGMPLGRRNGLQVSPLSGLSYGNQDLFGPVSINDKYDVNWGFLNKLGDLMNTASKKFLIPSKS
ncbi:unnamed protein product [Enterobius vermicularis]|uniref:ANF_receptor domain-containing protein n=1 Tax=Enterobius vermicularis TaxID=51028 RepID=A0A0N4V7U6_ENTVE|nr:unnamed protein product [Enterobius vermicularis]